MTNRGTEEKGELVPTERQAPVLNINFIISEFYKQIGNKKYPLHMAIQGAELRRD